MNKAPCKDCEDRFIGCHSVCDIYKEFQYKQEKEYGERLKRLDIMNYTYTKKEAVDKWRKHHLR